MLSLWLEVGFGVAGLTWLWEIVHAGVDFERLRCVASVVDCRGMALLARCLECQSR